MELKERCVCGCSARRFISLCLEWLERRGGAWGNVNQSHYTKDLTYSKNNWELLKSLNAVVTVVISSNHMKIGG